jgi:subtilisin family serine protease
MAVLTVAFGRVEAGQAFTEKDASGRLAFALNRLARAAETGQPLPGPRTQSADRVRVVLELEDGAALDAVSRQVAALGGRPAGSAAGLLRADVPARALRALAGAPGVRLVREPLRPSPKRAPAAAASGGVVSEGANTIHAAEFRARTGATGAGVRVAILDSAFGRAEDLVGDELPEDTEGTDIVLDTLLKSEGVHGTACAEIVHDVAPDAKLLLAGFEDEVSWAAEIDRLIGAGIRVVSHSIGFDNLFPPDGNHLFAQKVEQAAAAGVLFVTAAGNEGDKYYQGAWTDADSDLFLEFAPTGAELLPIKVGSGGGRVVLRWDDPFGTSSHDYDLLVVTRDFVGNPTLSRDNPAVLAVSADTQSGGGNPREIASFETEEETVYVVVVRDPSSPAFSAQRLWLWASAGVDALYINGSGTLSLPGDARGSLTVGASPFDNPGVVEGFSSRGPTADGRVKPDVAGPDGVSTAAYGDPFFGTSAATPHVAGAAALLLSRNPGLGAAGLRTALEQATPGRGQSRNNDLGFGTIDLNLVP